VTEAPRCSIVVPTYERPAALAACLKSLAALDYPRDRFDVVVVDDGGRAPLEPVVEPFRGRLDLTLLRQPRAGPAAARNAGAERAEGDLLAFTDDDCRPRPDWLRQLAGRFAASPQEAFGGQTINALPRNVYSAAAQLVIDVGYRQNNSGPPDRRWFTTNNLAVPAAGFRAVGGFDPSFRTSEDRDFCSRWVQSGLRMSYEPGAVVEHAHPLSLASFLQLHFAYGRGAFRYHREQRRQGRPVRVEPSFYLALARAPLAEEDRSRRLALGGLLVLWHLVNTAGFASEWALSAGPSQGSRASAGRR
jgi:glycosyltransferase involved in cell wall biosynthesis